MNTPFIVNVSRQALKSGNHAYAKPCILIQIADPDTEFVAPYHDFLEIHRYQFLDIEASGLTNNGNRVYEDMSEFAITQDQATEIVNILNIAFNKNTNVVVACVAGRCRSGSVCEVGTMIGFNDVPGTLRQPNVLVKSLMMKSLGWSYE